MAGEKVSSYSIGDVNLSALMTTTDAQRIGYHAVSLTEYDTDTKPEIAAGSKVEVNGALFKFDSDETITETPSDGDVYIKLIPNGTSITAEFTNDAPTWDDEKQGWYESGTNNRYLNYAMTKSGANYSDKYTFSNYSKGVQFRNDDVILLNTIPIYGYMSDGTPLYSKLISGTILNGNISVALSHGISNAYTNFRILGVTAHFDDNVSIHNMRQNAQEAGATNPRFSSYDDTIISLFRGSSIGSYPAHAYLVYR